MADLRVSVEGPLGRGASSSEVNRFQERLKFSSVVGEDAESYECVEEGVGGTRAGQGQKFFCERFRWEWG